jgi:hypothetical protein
MKAGKKQYSYSDSQAGTQPIKSEKLSDIIKDIENFGYHGDSQGIVYEDGHPILMYDSTEAGLSWRPA